MRIATVHTHEEEGRSWKVIRADVLMEQQNTSGVWKRRLDELEDINQSFVSVAIYCLVIFNPSFNYYCYGGR